MDRHTPGAGAPIVFIVSGEEQPLAPLARGAALPQV